MPAIIVALDVPTPDEALRLADAIDADHYKIGLELIYHRGGLDLARHLLSRAHVFLDAKLSDIPTTVARATAQICREIEPHYLSVRHGVAAAVEAASGRTVIADVASLSSDPFATAARSPARAIVCRPELVANVRALNPHAAILCPGVRLDGQPRDDHMGRTDIPVDADYIVVGRPITRATDPRAAFKMFRAAAGGA